MNRKVQWLLSFAVAFVALFSSVETVLAGGAVYYGGWGWDHGSCGSYWLPCGSYSYAYSRACTKSSYNSTIYYIYHVSYGYAGFCDQSFGSGTEPGAEQVRVPKHLLLATIVMTVVGFVAGTHYYGVIKRRKVN